MLQENIRPLKRSIETNDAFTGEEQHHVLKRLKTHHTNPDGANQLAAVLTPQQFTSSDKIQHTISCNEQSTRILGLLTRLRDLHQLYSATTSPVWWSDTRVVTGILLA